VTGWAPGGALLDIVGVDVHYGDLQAIFGVSLALAEGETVAVLGANGAGKSTLLKAITGMLPITAGEVRYDGRSLHGIPAHRRAGMGIALVPEGRRLFPSLTVEENLLVGGHRARPGPWNRGSVYELFPLLRPLRKRPASVLSGGEQQAVAIGRALMSNPRLLLLDEVSLGLAPVVVKQLYEALPAITASGATVLVVEQDMRQAMAVADRVHCLLEGRTALEAQVSEVTADQVANAYFGSITDAVP
jgi:branched-chain amino acid transport system ATP-binding protein